MSDSVHAGPTELLDPENVGVAFGNNLGISPYICTFGLAAIIMDVFHFRLHQLAPLRVDDIRAFTI